MTFKPNPNVIYFGETFSVRLSKVGFFTIVSGDARRPRECETRLHVTANRKFIGEVFGDLFLSADSWKRDKTNWETKSSNWELVPEVDFDAAQRCYEALTRQDIDIELDAAAKRLREEHSKRMSKMKRARDAAKAAHK